MPERLLIAPVQCPMDFSCKRYLQLQREIKHAKKILAMLYRELDDHTEDAHDADAEVVLG